LGTGNAGLFSSARYCTSGAQYGYLPEIFACIHKKRLTPIPSVVLQGLLGIALCLPSNIEGLIEFFSFVAWIFYGLTFVATLCCKFTMKNAERAISVSHHSSKQSQKKSNISGSDTTDSPHYSNCNLSGHCTTHF
jgi:L-type amino acid transporter 9